MRTFFFLLLTVVGSSAAAGTIEGQLHLKASKRLGSVDPQNAIVFFRPDNPSDTPLSADEPITMTMRNKMFDPTVLSVNVGTEIAFPNADRVIHNAFSTTKQNEFDLGFYNQGEERRWTFNNPGLVKVFCNVHQGMVGYVMVMDTPHHTNPDDSGRFVLDNVPPGVGKLFVWHPRGRTFTRVIEVAAEGATPVNASVNLNKRLVPKHKNKFGKPYKRNRDY